MMIGFLVDRIFFNMFLIIVVIVIAAIIVVIIVVIDLLFEFINQIF